MKFWICLLLTFVSVHLPVLGSLRTKHKSGNGAERGRNNRKSGNVVTPWTLALLDEMASVDECWVQPPSEYCANRCTRLQTCVNPNLTCCWAYCGNICLDREESFKTMLIP
ncbi:protein WFDC11 [Fukomys damarensis]|uniref:protein WFDC11 n=1 Tax=Fukomys damarensis TaxID=885580 RepID=UPI001454F6F9|nr:protein WFDC11 [Fukomys damarensis]